MWLVIQTGFIACQLIQVCTFERRLHELRQHAMNNDSFDYFTRLRRLSDVFGPTVVLIPALAQAILAPLGQYLAKTDFARRFRMIAVSAAILPVVFVLGLALTGLGLLFLAWD